MKQITITVPDNCELKQDGNTYTIVEKEKKLTYEDIARELFSANTTIYFIEGNGSIDTAVNYNLSDNYIIAPNNCTSNKQAEKLLAINELMNVAKYLNGDWQPDWKNTKEIKYYIWYDNKANTFIYLTGIAYSWGVVLFKSKELAKQAIEILGEETIKLALCTDY